MKQRQEPDQLDVDIRFLLANERTLLAWVRTSLAIDAGGLALVSLHRHHTYVGIIILFLGVLVALIGYHRYITAERYIRRGELPPLGSGPTIQVFGIVIIAILLAIAEVTFLH